jgi:hypothetical protein
MIAQTCARRLSAYLQGSPSLSDGKYCANWYADECRLKGDFNDGLIQ